MAVYVDDMYKTELGELGRMKMSHLIADSDEELHAMAALLGLRRSWHQRSPPASTSHYDISLSKRALAVHHGAIEIPMKVLAAMAARRRKTGALGSPDDALEWYSRGRQLKASGEATAEG